MTRSGRLQGKVALITGATEGIGAAVTRSFSSEGARLVLVARRSKPGRDLVAELPGESVFLPGDVSDPETATRAVSSAREAFGELDILVNNAAMDFS